jgi:tripartite-type tricarboxylate transporter receptor subunit TctC
MWRPGLIGLFGRRGLPPEIARRAATMLNEACWDLIARQRLAERGDEIGGGTAEEFAARVRREHAEWNALAREAGIRAR